MYFGITETISVLLRGLSLCFALKPNIVLLAFSNYLIFFALIVFVKEKSLLLLFIIVFAILTSAVSTMPYSDPNLNQLAFRYGFVATPFLIFFIAKRVGVVSCKAK